MKTIKQYILIGFVDAQWEARISLKADTQKELIDLLFNNSEIEGEGSFLYNNINKKIKTSDLLCKFTDWRFAIYEIEKIELDNSFIYIKENEISSSMFINSSIRQDWREKTFDIDNLNFPAEYSFTEEPLKEHKQPSRSLYTNFLIYLDEEKTTKLVKEDKRFENVITKRKEIEAYEKELAEMEKKGHEKILLENNLNQLSFLMEKYKDKIIIKDNKIVSIEK